MKRKWWVKILCITTFLLFATGGAACRSDKNGDGGDEPEVFLPISTVEELKAISGSESSYELTADLDLSGEAWEPIVNFSGKLDGKNHKISNLTVNKSNGTMGLFETLKGTVSNLTLDNVSVTAIGTTGDIGGLCGKADNAIIENVAVYGEVNAKLMDHIGGIAGYAAHTLINYCKNYANVEGYTKVGGVVGEYERQIASDDKYIEGNENHGNVTSLTKDEDSRTGGVMGEIWLYPGGYRTGATNWNFTVQSFKNFGTVTSAGGRTGGIIGVHTTNRWAYGDTYVDLSLAACTNEGAVTGTGYVGGIIGRDHYSKSVLSCENKGVITGTEFVGGIVGSLSTAQVAYNKNTGNVTAQCYVGGIVGYTPNVVNDCENAGIITVMGSTNDGGLGWDGVACAGGIAGATASYVTNSKNTGEIISKGTGNCIGGIAGVMRPSNGDIIENENDGYMNTMAGNCIGGIVGQLQARRPGVSHGQYTFTGKNTRTVNAPFSKHVGGLIGYISCDSDWSYQQRCYALIVNSSNTGIIVGSDRVGGIVGTVYKYIERDDIYWATNSNSGRIDCDEGCTKSETYNYEE